MKATFPSFSQWKQIFKVLSKKEKIAFLVFFTLSVVSLVFLITNFYLQHTKASPSLGGKYIEGVIGQPRLINPIYSETNDIDRTLAGLIFSGLMTYDNQGNAVKDLAESYKVSADGKVYDVTLQDDIFWHDGKELTVDDIVFTISTIQNSDYKSPLRANWIDVEVQKVSVKSIRFILKVPYNSFLENLTVKIIPKHIWASVSPENFTISPYNLQPVGSGSYKFASIRQIEGGFIKSIELESNRRYYNNPSYISRITFQFFEHKTDLLRAANEGRIDGFAVAGVDNNEAEVEKVVRRGWTASKKFSIMSFDMPRYFAVFFHIQKSSIFQDANLRKALTYAVNKEELLSTLNSQTKNNDTVVNSPILPDFFGYQQPSSTLDFNIQKANELLDKTGFKDMGSGLREKPIDKKQAFQFKSYLKVGSSGSEVIELQSCLGRLDSNFQTLLQSETSGKYGTATESAVTEFQKQYLPNLKPTGETGVSTRKKLNEVCFTELPNSQPLKFTLTTINQPQLLVVANLLQKYWQAVGVSMDINAVSLAELKPLIKNRSYDALLYGEALGAEPDLYSFWHSSQKFDPGLNLSSYENKTVDKLLKEAREATSSEVKQQKYEDLQDAIIVDAPALFLYNPNYIYWISNDIKGIDTKKIIDPAKRFSNITNWYIKTRRVGK